MQGELLGIVAGVKLEPASSPGGPEPWRAVTWTSPEVEALLCWLRDPEVYTWLDLEGRLPERVCGGHTPGFHGEKRGNPAIMQPLPWLHHCLVIASSVVSTAGPGVRGSCPINLWNPGSGAPGRS
ncbi:hypothetical protein AAFF_G00236330 [Aldrovandia affinis]|uniref:Uncharacterized protein n=1 Tax=Aldrovandia affinis TaxID=143900 RepID=A0AAD7RET7_9TELE|nr:hypothetical protein AAFF_G00236330 [Aldrovandia affinis]